MGKCRLCPKQVPSSAGLDLQAHPRWPWRGERGPPLTAWEAWLVLQSEGTEDGTRARACQGPPSKGLPSLKASDSRAMPETTPHLVWTPGSTAELVALTYSPGINGPWTPPQAQTLALSPSPATGLLGDLG